MAIEVEDAAHGLRRHRHAADAVAQDRGHRRQQHRRPLDRDARIGEPEAVDPGHLGKQPDHLPERQDDADQQHADDQRVERRVGLERDQDLRVDDDDDQAAQDQKDQHPHQKDAGRGNLERIDVSRHSRPFRRRSTRLFEAPATLWHGPGECNAGYCRFNANGARNGRLRAGPGASGPNRRLSAMSAIRDGSSRCRQRYASW